MSEQGMHEIDRAAEILPPQRSADYGRGPNLKLVYSILAVALLVAMGCAALIVLPFYRRR